MRIDRTHRPWIVASVVIFAVALGGYLAWALVSHPDGGGPVGITYGIAGYSLMLFAGLLGARKKVPIWRLGRAQHWMRGHIWLGLLTLPLILFHSGFSLGGHLTTTLVTLLVVVWLSGITGAVIQHFVPSVLTGAVPLETIYEQIPRVRGQLREEADRLARVIVATPEPELALAAAAVGPDSPAHADDPVEAMIEMETEEREYFSTVYRDSILPFLIDPGRHGAALGNASRAQAFFDVLRRRMPPVTYEVIADIESICDEERQLNRQRSIYLWMHGWLLVHVPLSITLLVLGGVHAIVALRY